MKSSEFINESAAIELAKKLPSLKKHDYNTIDSLMKKIAKRHSITGAELHDLFVKKYKSTPDNWIKLKKKSITEVDDTVDYGSQPIVQKFIHWTAQKLNLKKIPEFEFSYDTKQAQDGHHTGRHIEGKPIWVYVANRNMVDIFRTIFHELVHVRQSELNMIKPGDSYPGSPIEVMADVLAGKYIKIFGEKHHEIFQ